MRHPQSRQLHAYWTDLCGARPAPRRDEIDPAAIRGLLASVFLLDVEAQPLLRAEDATFRLTGTRLDALFGRPLRGEGFGRIWTARGAAAAAASLLSAIEGRPVVAAARGGPSGREALELELLLLPLAARGPGCIPLLGCLVAFSAPDWLGLRAAAPLDIVPPAPAAGPWGAGFGRRPGRLMALAGGRGAASPLPAEARAHAKGGEFRAP